MTSKKFHLISNKLSLNVSKIKYSFFHKPSKRDDIPLLLAKLNINNNGKNTLDILKVKLLKIAKYWPVV